MYQNPIVRGFHPDPSIIYAQGAFYLVNSTFQYFPAVEILRSTDLVNFHTVGHAVTRPEWIALSDVPDSHGVWAPDISYADGKYWIFAPLRLSGEGGREHTVLRRQLIMWADKPEGPYSKPVCLEMDSIDPSHFVDDDGKHYLVNAPGITVTPLTDDCTAFAGETVQAWPGTGNRAPEGPHLLKKDGWYYAILAEGGTGYGHQISVARSRSIYGPYEPCPHNPILKQNDPAALLQRCGHAKFLQLPDGRWYAVYLCARPVNGKLTVMGRETALQELTWDDEGWPHMGDGTPALTAPMPYPGTVQALPDTFRDDFDGPELKKEWEFVRTPSAEWSLTERPGCYRVWTEDGDLCERRGRNTLVHRETELHYTAETRLHFAPQWDGEQAGLCCVYGTMAYIKCALTRDGLELRLRRGEDEEKLACVPVHLTKRGVDLRVRVDELRRRFDYRLTDGPWQTLGEVSDCFFLSDEGLQGKGKCHTGTMVGLFATNGGCGSRKAADFEYFEYTTKERKADR